MLNVISISIILCTSMALPNVHLRTGRRSLKPIFRVGMNAWDTNVGQLHDYFITLKADYHGTVSQTVVVKPDMGLSQTTPRPSKKTTLRLSFKKNPKGHPPPGSTNETLPNSKWDTKKERGIARFFKEVLHIHLAQKRGACRHVLFQLPFCQLAHAESPRNHRLPRPMQQPQAAAARQLRATPPLRGCPGQAHGPGAVVWRVAWRSGSWTLETFSFPLIGGLDWFGLVWIGLDWFGLVWIGGLVVWWFGGLVVKGVANPFYP